MIRQFCFLRRVQCRTVFLQWQWSRLQCILASMVQNVQEVQRKGGFGSELTRIPTMFQLRPTTRRFFSVCVFVCVCTCVRVCLCAVLAKRRRNGTMLDQVVTVEFFSSSALSFPKPPPTLPETPSLDDNKDSPAVRSILPPKKFTFTSCLDAYT